MGKSLKDIFEQLRKNKRVGVLPFISAGYPDLKATADLLPALERAGASAIEVGIPFSDPIADGPVIQESYTAALSRGLKLKDVLKRFDGLILPDLPPPEAEGICQKVRAAGLDTILLVAPTSAPSRRKEIAKLCSGFIYYLSVSGITGERQKLPEDLAEQLGQLRRVSECPICVGFGISRREHVAQLAGLADGALVGSAIVRRIKEHAGEGTGKIVGAVESYVRELVGN
jgi:tryptophan synthase alpha chain